MAEGEEKEIRPYGTPLYLAKGCYWPDLTMYRGGQSWTAWLSDLEENFIVRDDDLYVFSFPKAGHHWSFEYLSMILKGAPQRTGTSKLTSFMEAQTVEYLNQLPSPRILVTHLPHQYIPRRIFEKGCKAVYLIRNPKDTVVSYYHHYLNKYSMTPDCLPWDMYLKSFLSGTYQYNGWFEYVLGWEEEVQKNANIMEVQYEECLRDFSVMLKKLAEFLGRPGDDRLYEEIAEACSFHNMQKNAQLVESAHSEHKAWYFRKGKVGDWKNHFTVAQSEEFNAFYKTKMKGVSRTFDLD